RIETIHGVVNRNGVPFEGEGEVAGPGVGSSHIGPRVRVEELQALAEILWQLKPDTADEPVSATLARRQVQNITVGRLVPLDTRWRAEQWPDRPETTLDPDYEESITLAQQTFEQLSEGRA